MLADGEPHLIFVANRKIEISEELLLDYNDKESKAEFLEQCPVCQKLGTVSVAIPTSIIVDPTDVDASAVNVSDETDLTAAPSASTTSHDVEKIARNRKATKAERAFLFEAFCKDYPVSMHTTRSVVEAWSPGIHEYNVDYIMNRRRATFMATRQK